MLRRIMFFLLACATLLLAKEMQVYMCSADKICESTLHRAEINIIGEKNLTISYDLNDSVLGLNLPNETYNVVAISADEIKVDDADVGIKLHEGIIEIKNAHEDFSMLYVPVTMDVKSIRSYTLKK